MCACHNALYPHINFSKVYKATSKIKPLIQINIQITIKGNNNYPKNFQYM